MNIFLLGVIDFVVIFSDVNGYKLVRDFQDLTIVTVSGRV